MTRYKLKGPLERNKFTVSGVPSQLRHFSQRGSSDPLSLLLTSANEYGVHSVECYRILSAVSTSGRPACDRGDNPTSRASERHRQLCGLRTATGSGERVGNGNGPDAAREETRRLSLGAAATSGSAGGPCSHADGI